MKKIAKIASALREAAGLGAYGGSNVRDYFRDGLKSKDSVQHPESGVKARKVPNSSLPKGFEYELSHPDGLKLRFDADELETLSERASMWADRKQQKKLK